MDDSPLLTEEQFMTQDESKVLQKRISSGTYFKAKEQLQMYAKRVVAKKIVTELLHEMD